jgi:LysR family transcriptional regulator, nod-box dependent transcriptional activator
LLDLRSAPSTGAALTLRNVDLNLLVVLDAVLSECNISRAGERMGLS